MARVKLTITESRCRGGWCKKGGGHMVGDLCPPLCHELWGQICPMVCALLNGAELDYGDIRAKQFDAVRPDEGQVRVHGEVMEERPSPRGGRPPLGSLPEPVPAGSFPSPRR